ncbi:MAG: DNA/RNA helicase domain-containing protein [Bacilli bacterium]
MKKIAKEQGEDIAHDIVDPIIRNTYKTLMTRGMKGCYVYCTNKELAEYLKERIKSN